MRQKNRSVVLAPRETRRRRCGSAAYVGAGRRAVARDEPLQPAGRASRAGRRNGLALSGWRIRLACRADCLTQREGG